MKKKLAILIAGMYREFDNAHKSWTFLNHEDSDVFISTWDKTHEINVKMNIDIHEDVTEERILKCIPNAFIKITPEFMDNDPNAIKMIAFHWHELMKMVKESGNEYDIILLTRTDLYIKEISSINDFINSINNDYLYGTTLINQTPNPPYIYINDVFFIAKFKVIEKIISSMENFRKGDDIHSHLARCCINNDIYVQSIWRNVMDFFTLRSSHRDILNYDFETLRNKGLEWYNTMHSL